jgi:hypothetical protein
VEIGVLSLTPPFDRPTAWRSSRWPAEVPCESPDGFLGGRSRGPSSWLCGEGLCLNERGVLTLELLGRARAPALDHRG